MRIARKVRGDTEQRVATMRLVLVVRTGAQETIVRLLQQVIRKLAIPRDTREVSPDRAGRPVVERPEGVLIHLEGYSFAAGGEGLESQALGVGHGRITQEHEGAPVYA